MPRPIRARIDLAALRQNHAIAGRHAGNGKLWSVVKADAYGHGLLSVALALQNQADGFALVEYEGAVLLREQGIRQPILMLEGIYQPTDLALCADHFLTPALHSLWQVEALASAGLPTAIPVYLKLNTGMNRLGLTATEMRTAMQWLDRCGAASSVTLMTHFADADEGRGIAEQLVRFQTMTEGLRLPMSIANSAALLRYPETAGGDKDWSRPGIMLYGASPMPQRQSAHELGLQPVMTLSSEIIGIQHLQAGDRVGYGGTFTATDAMTIGVVACGYADGYPRHAPTGTPVLVNGERTRSLGRVSMDKLCVDLTGMKVGSGGTAIPVTLWGDGLPADEVATAAGTIAYELFCALAGRVDIEYVG